MSSNRHPPERVDTTRPPKQDFGNTIMAEAIRKAGLDPKTGSATSDDADGSHRRDPPDREKPSS